MGLKRYDISFFTATILEWKYLLTEDCYKDIIISSLQFLTREKRIHLNGYVIMDNHLHLLWQMIYPNTAEKVQQSFLKYTAQMILKDLRNRNRELLQDFYVGASDRIHQIWERNPLSVPLWNESVVKEKLNYIHNNPVRAGLCIYPHEYKYSSAAFYDGEEDIFDIVTTYF